MRARSRQPAVAARSLAAPALPRAGAAVLDGAAAREAVLSFTARLLGDQALALRLAEPLQSNSVDEVTVVLEYAKQVSQGSAARRATDPPASRGAVREVASSAQSYHALPIASPQPDLLSRLPPAAEALALLCVAPPPHATWRRPKLDAARAHLVCAAARLSPTHTLSAVLRGLLDMPAGC